MSNENNHLLISAAQKQITEILSKLEQDTGTLLDRLDVVDIDVTNMGAERRQLMRRVVIEMKPLPGARWTV